MPLFMPVCGLCFGLATHTAQDFKDVNGVRICDGDHTVIPGGFPIPWKAVVNGFTVPGLRNLEGIREIIHALRYHNIPCSRDGCYHLYLQPEDHARFMGEKDVQRLIRIGPSSVRDSLGTLTPQVTDQPTILGVAIHRDAEDTAPDWVPTLTVAGMKAEIARTEARRSGG